MLVFVVVLLHWRFFRFRATFPCHRHSTLASQAYEGLHQLWVVPWLLFVTLLLRGFYVTALSQVLRFWAGIFYSQAFLPRIPSLHGTFCDSDGGRITPTRIHLCPCPHKIVPSGWRMVLNYSYCRLKTIGLPIARVSYEVRSH